MFIEVVSKLGRRAMRVLENQGFIALPHFLDGVLKPLLQKET